MKKAFTLAEVLIMVAILGILAAIVMPTFQDHTTEAKEAAAKDTLRILRNAIELYAAQHDDIPPGYAGGGTGPPLESAFFVDLVRGNYLHKRPKNPFNNLLTVCMIGDSESFPATATGQYGWIYQPQSKTIRLDWPGTDRSGICYYGY